MNSAQYELMRSGEGFIAALDQSGGSTPGALKKYGIHEGTYDPSVQFDLMHEMRSRIISDPAFRRPEILAAILFKDTLLRKVGELPTAQYLWEEKGIIPFVKIDEGLEDTHNNVQLMKDMPGLRAILELARHEGVFGTKMRSVIHGNSSGNTGINRVLDQQFAVAETILDEDLVPMIEPEANKDAEDKADIEYALKMGLLDRLDVVTGKVILKLTLPNIANDFQDLVNHPNVLRVVGLSGGYSREESCRRLAENNGMIASFSRALTEGLDVNQTEAEFHATLRASIEAIYEASRT